MSWDVKCEGDIWEQKFLINVPHVSRGLGLGLGLNIKAMPVNKHDQSFNSTKWNNC